MHYNINYILNTLNYDIICMAWLNCYYYCYRPIIVIAQEL